MKKGELKRDNILSAAEKLFFEQGYDQTSIQDILDALSISKGGFYHHFTSKEAILEEICEKRIASRFERLGMELYAPRMSPMDKINLLLRMVNLFDRDEPRFVALMLKICYLDHDVQILSRMRQLVMTRLQPYLDEVIAEGLQAGLLYTRHPGWISRMILGMVSDLDDEACRRLSSDFENPECIIDIADMLNACRDAIETLIGAPFGSVCLFDPEKLILDFHAAAAELVKLEGK